jgi:hypothetical protein
VQKLLPFLKIWYNTTHNTTGGATVFVRKNTAYTTLFLPLYQLVHWKYLAKFQAQTAERSMIWGEMPK